MYGYSLPQYHLEGERIKKQQFSFGHVLPKNLATILHYNVLKTTRLFSNPGIDMFSDMFSVMITVFV